MDDSDILACSFQDKGNLLNSYLYYVSILVGQAVNHCIYHKMACCNFSVASIGMVWVLIKRD